MNLVDFVQSVLVVIGALVLTLSFVFAGIWIKDVNDICKGRKK